MSISPVNNLNSYIQSLLNTALQGIGYGSTTTGNNLNSVSSSSLQQSDSGQLSPFAQVLNTLQQLQQSNPTQYQQVTQQIATNLTSAAQTAQSQGNTTAASQLTQLATDFTNASQNNQLPNIQDLAQAMSGHHHHHHHSGSAASSSSSSSSSSTSSPSAATTTSGTNQSLDQILAAFQTAGTGIQSNSLNPADIILNTLSSAGITSVNA
jgi:hypothetical protein